MRIGTGVMGAMMLALGLALPPGAGAAEPPAAASAPDAAAPEVAPLRLAERSRITGLRFGDKPFAVPDDGIFTEVMNKIGAELHRPCGPLEVFAWEINADAPGRADGISDALVSALRQSRFTVKAVQPKAVPDTFVVYTADRSDKRVTALLSFSPSLAADLPGQLIMVMCDAAAGGH